MQYDALSFGWYTSNGSPANPGSSFTTNANTRVCGFSFKPPASGIDSIRLFGQYSGTVTNSAHKLYIVEGITGKLFIIATVSTTNDTLTLVDYHNIALDDRVVIFGATMPNELVRGNIYWVVYANGNDIKLSNTQGGAAIDLTTTGTNVCVSKYIDHSELTTITTVEGSNRWLDFADFIGVNLSEDRAYHTLVLNLESNPTSNYLTLFYVSSFNHWSLSQYSTNLTTLSRAYNTYDFQHRITYTNGFIDNFIIGAGSVLSSGTAYDITVSDAKFGNIYKNNTETKLYIRSVTITHSGQYNSSAGKDIAYIARIRDKATKNILASSIPIKPYYYAVGGSQYSYFEFANPYELAVNQEVIISIEYYSGTVNLTNFLSLNGFSYNNIYYDGPKALFQRRGRTEPLLWQGSIYTRDNVDWIENTGATAKMYFIELQFDTFKPTGNVGGGGASVEPSYVF